MWLTCLNPGTGTLIVQTARLGTGQGSSLGSVALGLLSQPHQCTLGTVSKKIYVLTSSKQVETMSPSDKLLPFFQSA
jgi:hypothetical protein